MAKSCPLCEKTSRMQGARKLLRAHYNPVTWTRKYPNLQWVSLPSGSPYLKHGVASGRMKACTKCIKKGLHLKTAASGK